MGVRVEQEDAVFERLATLREEVASLWMACPSVELALQQIDVTVYFIRKCRDEHLEREAKIK